MLFLMEQRRLMPPVKKKRRTLPDWRHFYLVENHSAVWGLLRSNINRRAGARPIGDHSAGAITGLYQSTIDDGIQRAIDDGQMPGEHFLVGPTTSWDRRRNSVLLQ